MQKFETMLKENSPGYERSVKEMRYKLASACLEEFKTTHNPGRAVYSALSHLAEIPELEINMAHYDSIMFASSGDVCRSIYYSAKAKLCELEELLQTTA